MLDSKKRAKLKGIASTADTIFQLGKGGLTEQYVKEIAAALKARELIKLRVLENAEYTAREAAELLAERTTSEVVQVIGSKVVLYKRNPKKPVIEL